MAEHVINLESVDVFQQKHLVLSDVNLKISKGEFVFLIGATGSGKSSLLKIIYGELHISNGSGSVAGFNLKTLSDREVPFLRRKLGIVFQDFQLLIDRTIEQNLSFVLKSTGWKDKNLIDERIKDVLEKVGLRSKLKKMPHELSGGEQQRVVIARAITTRCCSPPESSWGIFLSFDLKPTFSNTSFIRSSIRFLSFHPVDLSTKERFCSMVRSISN